MLWLLDVVEIDERKKNKPINILVATDHYTRFSQAYVTTNQKAQELRTRVLKNMATHFHRNMTCIICTGIGNNTTVVLRKKNLGLLSASRLGHKHCADIFIREGADVNCTDDMFDVFSRKVACQTGIPCVPHMQNGLTPLMYAAGNGHLELLKKLIKAGADVNLVVEQMTALPIAAGKEHYKFIKSLIKAGANVNITDPLVMPPLICAVRTGDTENSRRIIEMLSRS